MQKICFLTLFLCLHAALLQAARGDLVSITPVETKTVAQLSAEATASTGLPATIFGFAYDITSYKVAYETLDYDGVSPTIATGLIVLPTNYPCAPPMCTYGHGLALKHWEAPSVSNNLYGFIGKGIAALGFIALLPDYIHLGVDASPGFQAFMHAQTEAAATIDLIRAARTYCQNNSIDYNDQLFISGYSQGGHSSMATCKAIQENYANEFTITAAMPGGGTYDLSGIAADSLASPTRTTGEPHALCLISRAYFEVYQTQLLEMGITASFDDFFKHPYDSLLNLILDASHPFADVSQLDNIPNRMLEDIYREEFMTNPDFWMRTFLAFNNLYDWAPQMPMRIFHSDADVENPFPNVLFTLNRFALNGATDVELQTVSGFGHSQAGLYHVLAMRQWFLELRQDCSTAIDTQKELYQAKPYPNPFTNMCRIDLQKIAAPVARWELLNLQGQILQSAVIAPQQPEITILAPPAHHNHLLLIALYAPNGAVAYIPVLHVK